MMQTDQFSGADLLDIIFAQRNRAYGAYILRREYPRQLARGLLGALALACLFIAAIYRGQDGQGLPAVRPSVTPVKLVDLAPSPPPLPRPPAAAPRETPPTVRDIVPVVVPDDQPVSEPVPTVEELAAAAPGYSTQTGDPGSSDAPAPVRSAGQDPAEVQAPPEPVVYDFHSVEQPAMFPGGPGAFRRFLENNLRDPRDEGAEPGTVLRVEIQFTIGADGQPGAYTLMQSGGAVFDREVMRVLRKMPRWKPARQNGRDVPMYFVLPVSFAVHDQE